MEEIIKLISANDTFGTIELIKNNLQEINKQSEEGNTVLMFSVYLGNKEIVEFLLKNGADRYLKNSRNETAEDIAIKNGLNEMIEILKE